MFVWFISLVSNFAFTCRIGGLARKPTLAYCIANNQVVSYVESLVLDSSILRLCLIRLICSGSLILIGFLFFISGFFSVFFFGLLGFHVFNWVIFSVYVQFGDIQRGQMEVVSNLALDVKLLELYCSEFFSLYLLEGVYLGGFWGCHSQAAFIGLYRVIPNSFIA